MRYSIITTTNARLDIVDAIDFENRRKPGLAKRFLDDLDQKLLIIAKEPYLASIRYENVRCIATNIFPYLIHYVVDDIQKQIFVLRILHTSRRPVW